MVVDENAPVGTPVGDAPVLAEDDDAGDFNALVYGLDCGDGEAAALFAIDASTGIISVASAAGEAGEDGEEASLGLDYERAQAYA